jgi:hypothetical protein
MKVSRVKQVKRVPTVPKVPTLEPGRSYPLISPQYDFSEEDEKELGISKS